MPASLYTAFTELRECVQVQNQYHDGTVQRSQLAQTSRRTFRFSKRLTASLLSALYSFWSSQNGGMTPFAFYDPFDAVSGQVSVPLAPVGKHPAKVTTCGGEEGQHAPSPVHVVIQTIRH